MENATVPRGQVDFETYGSTQPHELNNLKRLFELIRGGNLIKA